MWLATRDSLVYVKGETGQPGFLFVYLFVLIFVFLTILSEPKPLEGGSFVERTHPSMQPAGKSQGFVLLIWTQEVCAHCGQHHPREWGLWLCEKVR